MLVLIFPTTLPLSTGNQHLLLSPCHFLEWWNSLLCVYRSDWSKHFSDRDPGNISCWFWSLTVGFVSAQLELWQPRHFWLCWISRCFKLHMLFGERTSRGRQKEMCVSWWTTSKRGEGEGCLCRPNALHTSWGLGFRPCYHGPSQFLDSLLQQYQFGLLPCAKGILCPI